MSCLINFVFLKLELSFLMDLTHTPETLGRLMVQSVHCATLKGNITPSYRGAACLGCSLA